MPRRTRVRQLGRTVTTGVVSVIVRDGYLVPVGALAPHAPCSPRSRRREVEPVGVDRRWLRVAGVGVALTLALLLASCGGSDNSASDDTRTDRTASRSTTT